MTKKRALYFATLVFTMLAFFLQISPSVESSRIQAALGISVVEVANIAGIYLIVYGLMQIPNGFILDRYGIRILPIFTLLSLMGALIYWLFNYEVTLALSRLLSGLGCSIAFTSAIYIAKHIFSNKRLPFFVALVSVSASTGAIFATRFLKFAMDTVGWQATQVIMNTLVLLIVISSFFLAKNFYGERHQAHKPLPFNITSKFKFIFSQKKLIAIFAYSFFTWFIMMSFAGYWAKDYLIKVHNYSENTALTIMQIYWLSYLLSSLCIAYITKGIERCIKTIKHLAFLGALTFIFMALPFVFSYNLILLVAIFAGLSTASVPLGFSIITLSVPENIVALAVTTNNTFLVIGGLLGQMLFGSFIKGFSETPVAVFGGNSIAENYYLALSLLPLSSIIAFTILLKMLRNKKSL